MGRLEELKQLKYPIKDVAPYGECIVVPGDKFDPDWEGELDDQGISIVETDFGDPSTPVTLVQLKKPIADVQVKKPAVGVATPNEEKPIMPGIRNVRETAKVARNKKYGDDWQPDEDSLLLDLHNKHLPYYKISEQIREKFPRRTEHAIFYRIYVLMQQGKLQRRFERREQKSKKESKGDAVSSASAAQVKHNSKKNKVNLPTSILKQISKPFSKPGPTAWTDDEKKKLVKLWNEKPKLKVREIAPNFPNRSEHSVKMALSRLREHGLIRGRWKIGEKRKAEKGPKGPVGSEPASTPVHTPVRNASEDLAVQKLVETLGALTDVVDKLSCNAVMHALEIRELKSKDDFKIPLVLWTAYSNALLEDDKKYRDVFRDKVRKLLEASS
jgi:hypothetical protein